MTLDGFAISAGTAWLVAALVLGISELVAPGVFLVFLAIAAAITGIATFALPDLPLAAQVLSFAVWSGIAVWIGRRWYADYPVATDDPLLNDRAARMVGERVTVTQPIDADAGRVRLGDSEWPARGPVSAIGTAMRVAAVEHGVVVVEPIV